MAKTNAEKRLNMLNLKKGIYLNEIAYGKLHLLKEDKSPYGDKEYVYKGRIHKGEVKFVTGYDLEKVIPVHGDWDYGYTLEGLARELFVAEKALVRENPIEKRTFVYVNPESKLCFTGDLGKEYNLFVRVFDNDDLGNPNFRWVVIYLEEAR